MKQFVIAATLVATLFANSSFANDGSLVAPEVLKSFQSTFTAAKSADWSFAEDLYKVRFDLNGQHVTAYYKADGTMTALTRNISPLQLPLNLQTALKNEFRAQWVADLFEVSNDEGVQYYVTLEDANAQTVMKAGAGTWNIYQKQRKD